MGCDDGESDSLSVQTIKFVLRDHCFLNVYKGWILNEKKKQSQLHLKQRMRNSYRKIKDTSKQTTKHIGPNQASPEGKV